ncbi:MAG: hypothetical protein K2K07_15030 [Lachnospiraceae bacterium]|nr:hypothetical protein [Lachnospiraceae bacterium]
MINTYQFGCVEDQNCFEDGATNMIYFPVTDSPDFPKAIRDKAKEMIDSMVHTYETENNCKLDLSKLCLNARIIAFVGNNRRWSYEIAVVISSNIEELYDVWIERSYAISRDDLLYVEFRAYFMEQLEKKLFRG